MLKFESTQGRDTFVKRLLDMENRMRRGWDQGHDGRFYPSEMDMEDIKAAAAIIASSDVTHQ